MATIDALPGLKEIVGSLVFGANRPLKASEIRRCLKEVGLEDKDAEVYATVTEKQLNDAIEELRRDLARAHCGFTLEEVAGGCRLQSHAACGRWLKNLLNTKPSRLSRPALETLAIIAYRQPITRADVEAIRGVAVGHMIKAMMEMQLVRIMGRSELPGRPFLYGTTHIFLEHFGLKDLDDLSTMAPTTLMKREQVREDPAQEETVTVPEPAAEEDESS